MASIPATDYIPDSEEELYENEPSGWYLGACKAIPTWIRAGGALLRGTIFPAANMAKEDDFRGKVPSDALNFG
ncbi:hypothetical protein RclHR1_05670009 [Rhizophagus clarus]|uniref:Uncharacterized protein n=1 Tax=Rhizophagus clarus TaxID=94130 RepID=A0A2Z6SFW3_9GLOM|nr:hypothetical protein RclHR1_05670009 [Rhizophagus clarus]